jgi:hypothetical protein
MEYSLALRLKAMAPSDTDVYAFAVQQPPTIVIAKIEHEV